MRTLIVYYSNTGNNELLALHLQQTLRCEVLKIKEVSKRSGFTIFFDLVFNRNPKLKDHGVHLEYYDHFIFVAPIWAGRIASPLRAFLRNEKAFIRSYSFITFCGGGSNEQREKVRKEVETILARKASVVEELWVTRLPVKASITASYRASSGDLQYFQKQIEEFVRTQPSSFVMEK